MGQHLTSGEGKSLEEVELGDEPHHFSALDHGKGIKVVFLEQRLQLAHGAPARHSLHGVGHVLTRRILEKAVHHATSTFTGLLLLGVLLGMVTCSTPSLRVAVALSLSTATGNGM